MEALWQTPPDVIGQLVERFGRNLAAYKSPPVQRDRTPSRIRQSLLVRAGLGHGKQGRLCHGLPRRDP